MGNPVLRRHYAGVHQFVRENLHRFKQIEPFLPFDNPTFGNPDFEDASCRVLIVRLSPFRDVDRSIPHLFLFQEVRRALPDAYIDLAFFPSASERALFEREDMPFLIGTQSLRSAGEFDLVLVSNAYTLELINLPYLLIAPASRSWRGSAGQSGRSSSSAAPTPWRPRPSSARTATAWWTASSSARARDWSATWCVTWQETRSSEKARCGCRSRDTGPLGGRRYIRPTRRSSKRQSHSCR